MRTAGIPKVASRNQNKKGEAISDFPFLVEFLSFA